jgi:hypothetical protein
MKIGFTGTRKGMTREQLDVVEFILRRNQGPSDEFHHGDCLGADAEADKIAHSVGIPVIIHPPTEKKERAFCQLAQQVLRPKPYIQRNHDIVDAVEMLIATPRQFDEVARSGTWATIRYARLLRRDIAIIQPDGTIALQ